MEGYLLEPVGPFAPALGAVFNTFTTRQDVSPLPLALVGANKLHAGSRIRIEAEGEFSTTGTPTLSVGCYIGAMHASGGLPTITTVIAENTAITTGSGAASWPWRLDWRGICTVPGTSGSVVGSGVLEYGTGLTAVTIVPIPSTLALRTITWDTTATKAIGICATWGTSSASNSIKTYEILVTVPN